MWTTEQEDSLAEVIAVAILKERRDLGGLLVEALALAKANPDLPGVALFALEQFSERLKKQPIKNDPFVSSTEERSFSTEANLRLALARLVDAVEDAKTCANAPGGRCVEAKHVLNAHRDEHSQELAKAMKVAREMLKL